MASGVDFLGWVHFPDHRVLRTATKKRMMRKIALHSTEETITSYKGLLSHGNARKILNSVISDREAWVLASARMTEQNEGHLPKIEDALRFVLVIFSR